MVESHWEKKKSQKSKKARKQESNIFYPSQHRIFEE